MDDLLEIRIVIDDDFTFEDVWVVESLVGFVNLISADLVLNGLDIAKYILATRVCTHLELEKLVYMCYADYLCSTHKRLFEDKIYVFRYGSVIKSVYEQYKGMKGVEDGVAVDEKWNEDYAKMPARSRILFAEDGIKKIAYINITLEKYSCLSATELVNVIHVAGGPWDSVEKDSPYAEISDSIISITV